MLRHFHSLQKQRSAREKMDAKSINVKTDSYTYYFDKDFNKTTWRTHIEESELREAFSF